MKETEGRMDDAFLVQFYTFLNVDVFFKPNGWDLNESLFNSFYRLMLLSSETATFYFSDVWLSVCY